jgi:U3 small nucleolar RNA-associated protein 12
MSAKYGLCCAWGPANRNAIVGCKGGQLQVFDVASGDLIETHEGAHEGAVWSIAVRPDGRGLVTGGADKCVKFWDFDVVQVRAGGGGESDGDSDSDADGAARGPLTRQLTLVHTRTMKMTDDVLSVAYSHHKDSERLLLAVALLDCTVKIFFEDTLKFFVSLYGHKLPVMSMSISSDNSLIATASADKNIKVWGLEFGDCHRSMFAHADSVMSVTFVPRTHYAFTVGKDGDVKYWDLDRFEHIFTLEGHKGPVWGAAMASHGKTLYTGAQDRSLRVWQRTEEMVFLQEEREKRMEEMFDKELRQPAAEDPDDPRESTTAAMHTSDTAKAADRLLEALELCEAEQEKWEDYMADVEGATAVLTAKQRAGLVAGDAKAQAALDALVPPPKPSPLLLNRTPAMHMLATLRAIRASDLEDALLVLPFAEAMQLVRYLHHLLRRDVAVQLCTTAVLIVLRVHHAQVVSNQSLVTSFAALQATMQARLRKHKDDMGFNLAGLQFLRKEAAAAGALDAGPEATVEQGEEEPVGKRRKLWIF